MSLFQMSVTGGILVVAIIAIRALAMNLFPKKIFLLLWGITLFRLLLPLKVPFPWCVYTLADRTEAGVKTPPLVHIPPFTAGEIGGEQGEMIGQASGFFSPWTILWLSGLALFLLYFGITLVRSRRRFLGSLPVKDDFTQRWLADHRLLRRISIRQSDRVNAPLTYGILRPVILMPKNMDWTDTERLQFILQHEYVHIRRMDALLKGLLILALCIHWFNPLVWVMFFLANRDLELSCDESVIRTFGEAAKSAYALTLINMEERKSGLSPSCSSFSKCAIEERVRSIMKYKKTSLLTNCAAVVLVIGLFLAFATSAEGMKNESSPSLPSPQEKYAASADSPALVIENAELRFYDNGWPYLHEIWTNHTDRTTVQLTYYMLGYDTAGRPLQLHWNFLDSSEEVAYECLVDIELNLSPGQTYDEPGGWSLYDEDKMPGWPKVGDGGPNRLAYGLYCIKQITFEDGKVWDNPDCESWLNAYRGKEVELSVLQNYYPYAAPVGL